MLLRPKKKRKKKKRRRKKTHLKHVTIPRVLESELKNITTLRFFYDNETTLNVKRSLSGVIKAQKKRKRNS